MATTPVPTTQTPGELARAMFAVLAERRLDDAAAFWTEQSTDHFLALGISVTGQAALTDFFRELFAAFPDFHMEVENVVDDGERQAVVQWRARGTFTGERWQGLEPTGASIDLHGVDAIRFDDDGKVQENTVYYDGATFARQIGMLPKAGGAADRATLAAFNAAARLRRRARRRG